MIGIYSTNSTTSPVSWIDWPHSSAYIWLKTVSAAETRRIWHAYPVLNSGKGGDDLISVLASRMRPKPLS